MATVPVSFLVPIRNEAANLPRCLKSVAWADEIFVVDSNSTDGSQRVAEEHGARVVQFQFNGTWPKKKNWALENLPFRNEWIFILDADEVLPPETEEEFLRIISNPDQPHAGYWINRRFMFMGRWLKHAYYPNWNLRLFKHHLGRYEKLTEVDTQSGDNEVHEHVVVQGTTGFLKADMDHYAFPSVEVFVEKHNRYSNWEARVALDQYLKAGGAHLQKGHVGLRRRLKRLSQRLPCRPLLRFLYVYLGQRGFMDGREGYYFARLHGIYEFLSVAKTFELKKTAPRGQNPPPGPLSRLSVPAFFLCLATVFYFALMPNHNGSRLRMFPPSVIRFMDRHDDLANFSAFFIFGSIVLSLPKHQPASSLSSKILGALSLEKVRLALLLALISGLEFAQLWIPGRISSLRDIETGSTGVFLAWVVYRCLKLFQQED